MSKTYVTILIETDELEQVRLVVETNLGTARHIGALHYEVLPTPSALRHGVDGYEDEAFFEAFDVSRFACDVDIYTAAGSVFAEALAPLGDGLAAELARELNCRVIVFLDGTNVPLCVHRPGADRRWCHEAREYLQRLTWVPREE